MVAARILNNLVAKRHDIHKVDGVSSKLHQPINQPRGDCVDQSIVNFGQTFDHSIIELTITAGRGCRRVQVGSRLDCGQH